MISDLKGGSAFPRPADAIDDGCEGMSLRDWFAGQALAGIMAEGAEDYSTRSAAECAYALADAMLQAREAGIEPTRDEGGG